MNILVVSSYLPFPLLNGGNIRLYNILKELSKNHSITLVCEKRSKQTLEDVKEVEKFCKKVITVERKKQWSLKNILKAGLSRDSFLKVGHHLPEMREIISAEIKSNNYDVIHVETFYILQNVPKVTIPIVLIEHNIEYLVYERFKNTAPFFMKPFLKLDISKIKREEEQSWMRADFIGTVSLEEKNIIGRDNVEVVANGVDTRTFSLKKLKKEFKGPYKVLYIGDYSWVQNRDAVKYIIQDIWPHLKNEIDVILWIVGRNMPESLKELGKNDDRISFDDNNTSPTHEIFSEADVLLAPKRVGGGTSYKVLEAMAVGTPVIANTLGVEGFKVHNREDVLIANTSEDLANMVVDVLNDKSLAEKVSINGRKTVEKYYTWSSITADLEQLYKKALHKSKYTV